MKMCIRDRTYGSLVEDVLDRFASNDALCESAPQQSVNGVYRCVELLSIIAYRLDDEGAYGDLIGDVLDNFASNDARCESAPQQSANGIYRCAELLAIIAYELDTSGVYGPVSYTHLDVYKRQTSISFHTASSGKPSAGGETAHEASKLWALPL